MASTFETMNKKVSLIVPVFNEEGNVLLLAQEIRAVAEKLIKLKKITDYELIFVNDGSRDGTSQVLEEAKKQNKKIIVIELRKNFGQTAALKAGFDVVSGDYIVTMDGDMQNDPADIPRLIETLEKGFDVVSGWRANRKDTLGKRISSRIMNALRQKLIGDFLHDYGCSLKIYRRECVQELELYGELHRYITAYLFIKGYRIGEIKVHHRPRKSGKTKYGFGRGLNGILDLFYLKFWSTYGARPLHFFGRLGIYQWVLAGVLALEQVIKAIVVNELRFGPVLALASMLIITGLLFIIFGFLSETLSRLYLRESKIYSVKRIL